VQGQRNAGGGGDGGDPRDVQASERQFAAVNRADGGRKDVQTRFLYKALRGRRIGEEAGDLAQSLLRVVGRFEMADKAEFGFDRDPTRVRSGEASSRRTSRR
jgi:hypothetical protein